MPPFSGARSQGSQLPLIILGAVAVLLGTGLFFAYSAKTDVEAELEKAKNAAAAEKRRAETLEATLQKAVPWFVAGGEGGVAGEELTAQAAQVADAVKQELVAAATKDLPEGTSIPADRVAEHLRKQGHEYSILEVVKRLKSRIQTLEAEAKTQQDRLEQEKKNAELVREEARKSLAEKDEQNERLRRDTARAKDEAYQAQTRLSQERSARADETASLRDAQAQDEKDWKLEKNVLERKIAKLEADVQRFRRGGDLPGASNKVEEDGRVIDLDQASDTVIIDIGGQQRVRPGMRFDVYWREKGGMPVWKGKVEVIQVDPKISISRARILREREYVQVAGKPVAREYDPNDPITPGCIVANPYFDPGRKASFALVGEFQYHTVDELKRLLTADGAGEVVNDVTAATFVVLGRPPKVYDAAYESQREEIRIRKLEVMSEEEVMNYLRNYKQDDEIGLSSR